ncbi:MAG: MotA/TolQ/ExbB proton channel family protein [Prevotella sp.]|jgi:biopolymer transport protein ExbB|nr:MotA/TolQ/ExbB proton channel family protein [Prevotella sp.]
MATTKKAAAPKKQSQGFQGVRGAFWIIVVCAIIAFTLFFTWFGHESHFAEGGVQPKDVWGTIYKGGIIVPVIHSLLLTVLAMTIERSLALKTAFGKGALPKFVANIKAALNANDFAKAQQLCDQQKGSVANVVGASLKAYKEMEATSGIKKAQKIAKIQQAHEEATQLEMPTLTMNLPIIATIVTLGTLTGLLGTVVGMIKAFSAMNASGGADSAELASGISEALINTAFGIGTSWCAVVSYNYFTNKVDKLTFALDEVGYSIAQTYEATHTEEA